MSLVHPPRMPLGLRRSLLIPLALVLAPSAATAQSSWTSAGTFVTDYPATDWHPITTVGGKGVLLQLSPTACPLGPFAYECADAGYSARVHVEYREDTGWIDIRFRFAGGSPGVGVRFDAFVWSPLMLPCNYQTGGTFDASGTLVSGAAEQHDTPVWMSSYHGASSDRGGTIGVREYRAAPIGGSAPVTLTGAAPNSMAMLLGNFYEYTAPIGSPLYLWPPFLWKSYVGTPLNPLGTGPLLLRTTRTDGRGRAAAAPMVPNDPALVGRSYVFQWWLLVPHGPFLLDAEAHWSNAARVWFTDC